MSEDILIHNGLVVTADKRGTIHENGYIRVSNVKIAEIGSGKPRSSSDTIVDASGCVVIPGLITAHTHLYGILLRGASLNIKPLTDFAQVL